MENLINNQTTDDIAKMNHIINSNNNNNNSQMNSYTHKQLINNFCNTNNNQYDMRSSSSSENEMLSPSTYISHSSDIEDDFIEKSYFNNTTTTTTTTTTPTPTYQYNHQYPQYYQSNLVYTQQLPPLIQHSFTPLPPPALIYQLPEIYGEPKSGGYPYQQQPIPTAGGFSSTTITAFTNKSDLHQPQSPPTVLGYSPPPTPFGSYYMLTSHQNPYPHFPRVQSYSESKPSNLSTLSSPPAPSRKRALDQADDYDEEEDDEEENVENEDDDRDEEKEQTKNRTKEKLKIQTHTHTGGGKANSTESGSNVTTPSLSSPSLSSPSPLLSPSSFQMLLPLGGSTGGSSSGTGPFDNKEHVLFVQITESQETIYKNLLKENIPKMNSKQESEKSLVLIELYHLLLQCCNHPVLPTSGVPDSPATLPFIQSSGKLLNLERLIDNAVRLNQLNQGSNSTPKQQIIILTNFGNVVSILKNYFNFKALKYYLDINYYFRSQHSTNDDKSISILLSTYTNFIQYTSSNQIHSISNSVIIEFDQYFDIHNLSNSAYKSLFSVIDFQNNYIYKLISFSTVEEWVYMKCQQPAKTLAIGNADLIDMMKFCILKMSNYKKPSSPQVLSTPHTAPPPLVLPSGGASTSSLSSPRVWAKSSKEGSPSPSQESPSLTSTTTTTTSTSTSASSTPSLSSEKKKSRSPKRLKLTGEKICFSCKKEEDSQGNGPFVQCRSCPMCYHRGCVGLQNTPRSWKCIRHFCSVCRKTPNDSGGSFFICKSCPLSYCITCLPEGVKILQKHEYFEVKNKSSALLKSEQADDDSGKESQSLKKQKVQRPIVYILCVTCFQDEQSNPSLTSSPPATTTSSKYKSINQMSVSGSTAAYPSSTAAYLTHSSGNVSSISISGSNSNLSSPPSSEGGLDSPTTPSFYMSSDNSSDYLN